MDDRRKFYRRRRQRYDATYSLREGVVNSVIDMVFSDSHALWTQHFSGAFSQIDLHFAEKPVESVPRVALCWDSTNLLAHVTDVPGLTEIPYDDMSGFLLLFLLQLHI